MKYNLDPTKVTVFGLCVACQINIIFQKLFFRRMWITTQDGLLWAVRSQTNLSDNEKWARLRFFSLAVLQKPTLSWVSSVSNNWTGSKRARLFSTDGQIVPLAVSSDKRLKSIRFIKTFLLLCPATRDRYALKQRRLWMN